LAWFLLFFKIEIENKGHIKKMAFDADKKSKDWKQEEKLR